MTSTPRQTARETARAPLSSLGIPFGLSGLAGTWTMAGVTSLAPQIIAEGLWMLAAAAWIAVVVNYLWRARNHGGSIREDLRDPVQGAFASLAPTSAMLVCTHYAQQLPIAGRIVTGVFMAIGLFFGAWFLAQLALRQRSIDATHAGYLLPTVAAAFIVGRVQAPSAGRSWARPPSRWASSSGCCSARSSWRGWRSARLRPPRSCRPSRSSLHRRPSRATPGSP